MKKLLWVSKTNKIMETNVVKEKLRDILAEVSYGQICIQYFKKTPSWLYNKINRNIVNGKTAEFSEEELKQFKCALYDLSARIQRVADTL